MGTDILVDQAKGVTEGSAKFNAVHGQGPEESVEFGVLENKALVNESTKGELENAKVANFPKDAVDEWPAPKQIHNFFVIKFRPYDDPKLKAKIDQAEREIQKRNQAQFQLVEAIKKKQSERSHVISQLKPLTAEDKKFRASIGEKRKEMEPFQDALGKLRTAENARISEGVCSSEEELDERIRSLNFRLNHESNTIAEEKQILKDMKFLEGTREKVIKSSAMKAKIGDSYGQKKDMIGQVKQIGGDLDAIRKDQQGIRSKIKKLEEELKAIDDEIISLREELAAGDLKKNKAFETLKELRKAYNEVNACFYQNRSLVNSVKELAAKKDITSLEELCHAEEEKFMAQWCGSKKFRDDYEMRILASLDNRQLCRDGRMRNPEEKPIIVIEVTKPSEPEPASAMLPVKSTTKRSKEDAHPLHHEKVPTQKAHKEEVKVDEVEEKGKKGTEEEEAQAFSGLGKSTKEPSPVNETDSVKLKEMKREEELAKAKVALERKKKLAEKAVAKAAAKAQKEAEKKLKEKEKKAKKKANASVPDSTVVDDEEQNVEEPVEPEVNEESSISSKKQQKDTVSYRSRQKSAVQAPKPIIRRKKSSSYWMWAAPAAILAVFAAILAYYYTLMK